MKTYEVGDVLWIVSSSRPGIQAVRVTEELIKKTMSGTNTSYMVESAGSENKYYSLEKINGTVFKTSDEAKTHMLSSAEKAIDSMLTSQMTLVHQRWLKEKDQGTVATEKSDEYAYLDLENGQKAKIKLPPELGDLK